MSKVEKRIKKTLETVDNALVVGHGFDIFENILATFGTVFIISNPPPPMKARNLVFKEGFIDFSNIVNLSAVFFDRNQVNNLSQVVPLLHKTKPVVFIEGHFAIEREFSKPLYDAGYQCVDLQSNYHVWKYII